TVYRGPFTFRANGVDWWATGMALVALAALCVVIDVVTTVFARRTSGKPLSELPPFAWNSALAGVLGLLAYPALLVALVLLQCDRLLEAGRFVPESGGDATLWSRLTALLGHPQVAMLLLPVMGVVSEVVGAAAGRPVHGRGVMRVSSALLMLAGVLGWLAQATPVGAALAYALLPLAGAIMALATGIAVFHWLATLWGRPLNASPALSFALGMAAMVMTGAFSTLPLAFQPASARQVGTYFGVAHAHEMLFGGVVLGLVAALYHFYPKLTGRVLDARLGQVHFALTLVGAFVTFLPMHVLGLAGMPRRIHRYPAGMGWDALNSLASLGALVLLAAGLVFLAALLKARPVSEPAPAPLEPAGSPGPMLLAFGLALLATGTLLGWIAGTLGAGFVVFGLVRLLGDAKS
ncbi:MAG: cbb3-type cytochrome c oxidase subunit I, partial [Candidatus Eisenbacteria bacterium]